MPPAPASVKVCVTPLLMVTALIWRKPVANTTRPGAGDGSPFDPLANVATTTASCGFCSSKKSTAQKAPTNPDVPSIALETGIPVKKYEVASKSSTDAV